jgi:bifunctional aspartokinase / homoserine dehydrogenase 1
LTQRMTHVSAFNMHNKRERRLIVMKFGGTSVGTPERFRQCAGIVCRSLQEDNVIVVLSAVAGITDLIFHALEAAREGDAELTEKNLKRFDRVHRELIDELFEERRAGPVLNFATQLFDSFRASCRALLALGCEISAPTQDSVAALGERISAWIFANYLEQAGAKGRFVPAEDVVVTDSHFGNASPEMAATTARCRDMLLPWTDEGIVPVVAGYSGADRLGRTTTLGRGGSDYSATIIGSGCGADEVWIWTDVDGILTADPRICPAATSLPEISFTKAVELAYQGAKVLHPKAACLAMESGIPVWIKNSFRPDALGTKIVQGEMQKPASVQAIACVSNASLLTLLARRELHASELFGRVLLCFAQAQVESLFATQSTSRRTLAIAIRREEGMRVLKLVNSLLEFQIAHGALEPPVIENDVATITVLGDSPESYWDNMGRSFSLMARNRIRVIAISQGTSDLNVSFAVPSSQCSEAVRIVHEGLFETVPQSAIPATASIAALHRGLGAERIQARPPVLQD